MYIKLDRMKRRVRCPESGKAIGLYYPPDRRVHCAVCGRYVRIVQYGEHLVVNWHYWPPISRPPRPAPGTRNQELQQIEDEGGASAQIWGPEV